MYKAVRMFNYKDGLGLEQEALKGVCEVEEHVCSTEDDIIKYCQDADAVMGIFEPLTARVINSLPKLKLIACKSMGYNYVDLEAAKARGISVTHLRSAFSIDVADYVTACILAHNKRLFAYDRSVRRDKKWDYSVCPDIHRFNAETVGLAGFGQIARLVAKNLSGFGVRILAADPYIDQSVGDQYGVTMVDMKTLFRESDYISLHVPLIEGTEHLIGKELFDEIPDHLVFINSARGGVVVEQEMIDAIDSGKISCAYLDVLTDEYPDLNTHPLANRDTPRGVLFPGVRAGWPAPVLRRHPELFHRQLRQVRLCTGRQQRTEVTRAEGGAFYGIQTGTSAGKSACIRHPRGVRQVRRAGGAGHPRHRPDSGPARF